MVKIEEHKQKMASIKEEMKYVGSAKRYNQLKKCYHRLMKQLMICEKYLKEGKVE